MEGPVRYKESVESYLIEDGVGSHTVDLGTPVLSMKGPNSANKTDSLCNHQTSILWGVYGKTLEMRSQNASLSLTPRKRPRRHELIDHRFCHEKCAGPIGNPEEDVYSMAAVHIFWQK